MKRICKMLMLLGCVGILSGCDAEQTSADGLLLASNEETVSQEETIEDVANLLFDKYYPVMFSFEYEENLILSKNVELNIYIDDVKIGEMKQGERSVFGTILEKGDHKIKVSSSIFNTDAKTINVDTDRLLGFGAYNMYFCTVQYKKGDAEISDISGTNITSYMTVSDKAYDYGVAYVALMSSYKALGDFDEVLLAFYQAHPEIDPASPMYDFLGIESPNNSSGNQNNNSFESNDSINEYSSEFDKRFKKYEGAFVSDTGDRIVVNIYENIESEYPNLIQIGDITVSGQETLKLYSDMQEDAFATDYGNFGYAYTLVPNPSVRGYEVYRFFYDYDGNERNERMGDYYFTQE